MAESRHMLFHAQKPGMLFLSISMKSDQKVDRIMAFRTGKRRSSGRSIFGNCYVRTDGKSVYPYWYLSRSLSQPQEASGSE